MRARITVSVVILVVYAFLHGSTTLQFAREGYPWSMTGALAFCAWGNAAGAYGLIRKRFWGRVLAVGIGWVGLVNLLTMAFARPASVEWTYGAIQVVPFGLLAILCSGKAMRAAFEESEMSPWRFDSRLARLARTTAIFMTGGVAMLFTLGAMSVYGVHDSARIASGAAGIGMGVGLLLLAWGKTAGVFVLGPSALLAAAVIPRVVSEFDRNPCFASHDYYWGATLMSAVSATPAVALSLVLCAAMAPEIARFARGRS